VIGYALFIRLNSRVSFPWMHFLVVGVPTHHTTLHNAMYVIAIGGGFYGIVKQDSFAAAILFLLLMFVSSLFLVVGVPTDHIYLTKCNVRYSYWQVMLRG